jgi:hypothetical protein
LAVEVRLVRRDELHARRPHARLERDEPVDQREPEPAGARRGLGYELRARGYSPSPPPPAPAPGATGDFFPAARARFGLALCALMTSSVMSIDLSL